MSAQDIHPGTYLPQDQLFVWALIDPANPTLVGALGDARPDRWGKRIIRHVDRPARLSILELLLFAGDGRLGALGVSVSANYYQPRHLGPYPQLRDLLSLARAIEDVQLQVPITPDIRRLVQSGVSLGGACIIKFSELGDHDSRGNGGHHGSQHQRAATPEL